jgi:hypothetical protein
MKLRKKPDSPRHVGQPTPKKKQGQGRGPRSLAGAILDVRTVSQVYGGTEKFWRGKVANQSVPFRKWRGRIIFIRSELDAFFSTSLPGLTLERAIELEQKRRGDAA